MNQTELRAEPRVSVTFPGTLAVGDKSAQCQIQNMCSRGFLIKHSKELPVGPIGQILRLKCELYPARYVECTVQVRHVNSECLGARVVAMNDDGRLLCQQFLDEQRATDLRRVTQG